MRTKRTHTHNKSDDDDICKHYEALHCQSTECVHMVSPATRFFEFHVYQSDDTILG